MSTALPPNGIRHALVLGGGGAVGLSWMAGLVGALREAGIDLAAADRIVGTSAGSIIGAILADGGDIGRVLQPPSADSPKINFSMAAFSEVLGILMTPGIGASEAWRRAGARALEMGLGDPEEHVARMAGLIGTTEWPDKDLVVTVIDVTEGKFRAATKADGIPLERAIAASTCAPGVFPPIPIDGHHYMDGGLRSPVNADLAAGAEVIVIVEPLAHLFPRAPKDTELGSGTVFSIAPEADAIGPNVFDPAQLLPAYEAGVRQGHELAPRLKDLWPAA
ncbi:patatin-like phospholipase family protein [Nocardia yamanashiensis]|uniref:patatin-like phospholipase family protein n=1 Tax=Nocardia yamanashiensis TaxID=209247 RepID=UPI001E607D76|nr:patatin-like phospholipase family protein [Nocardia yamanashiensis]UGT43084.1 patatin-like phospholipase family protein [Nocardia yamanashiensis]